MTTQFTPVANLGFLYMNKMPFGWGSTTTLTVGAGQCRDSNNVIDISVASTLTITSTLSGALGLDTGTVAASTWYYVYVIAASNNELLPTALYSLSATTPTLPTGYDSYRMVGATLTDGSSHFLKFWQAGAAGGGRTIMWDVLQVVNATLTSSTVATISVATGVPPLASVQGIFWAGFTPNAAGDIATFRITGSTATTPLFTLVGNVAAKISSNQLKLLTEVATGNASIDYLVTASGNLSLSVQGFELSL